MKKLVIVVLFLCFCFTDGFGQMINGDFEEWDGNSPNRPIGWGGAAEKSTDRYFGAYSLYSKAYNYNSVFLHNNARFGYHAMIPTYGGVKIPLGANQISCWYKLSLEYEISANVKCNLVFTRNSDSLYKITIELPSVNEWTPITLAKFSPISGLYEDSVAISFELGFYGSLGRSYLYLDGVSFDTVTVSVDAGSSGHRQLCKISPNPISKIANLQYDAIESSLPVLRLFSIRGDKVKDFYINGSISRNGSVPLFFGDVPNGVYSLVCNFNGVPEVLRVVVIH